MNDTIQGIFFRVVVFFVVACAIYGSYLGVVHLIEQDDKQEAIEKERCELKGNIWDAAYESCDNRYEECMRIVRNTFQDLNDTIGSSQNHEDAISSTMHHEITRCLETL